MRASQLELTAHHLGCRAFAARIAGAAPDRPWQTRWSHGRRATDHQVLTGHHGPVWAVAAGALPDGTPVILSRHSYKRSTVRALRTAEITAHISGPLIPLPGEVYAVAGGALPDRTPVIISGGDDGTVRGAADRRRHPGRASAALPDSVWAVAVYGNDIITAAGADIAVHQPTLPRPMR
jgi:hypothetical protein